MAEQKFDNTNLNTFFDTLNGGTTWSAGVAFKRSMGIPLERYEVHESYEEALAYAQTNPVAYPGQVIAVVEKENNKELVKIYYINVDVDEDGNSIKVLEEVGTSTDGDGVTIKLDPVTKKLSIVGFADAGYSLTKDTTVNKNKIYYIKKGEGDYEVVTLPTDETELKNIDPSVLKYYEYKSAKLIKNAGGNLAWVTDEATDIQGDISDIQYTLNELTDDYDSFKETTEQGLVDVNTRITSLGTVFNFVGEMTIDAYTNTMEQGAIKADVKIPDGSRGYRVGDVVIVAYTPDNGKKYYQEYVVVSKTEEGRTILVWEAFGDPDGLTGLKNAVATNSENITGIFEDIGVEGSGTTASTGLYLYAEQKADAAKSEAIASSKSYVDGLNTTISNRVGQLETDINTPETGLKGQVTNLSNEVSEINANIGDTTITGTITQNIANLNTNSATKSELEQTNKDVTALSTKFNDYYTATQADAKFASKSSYEDFVTGQSEVNEKVTKNVEDINLLKTSVNGADGNGGLTKDVADLKLKDTTIEGNVQGLTERLDKVDNSTTGTVAKAQLKADDAYILAGEAKAIADTALQTTGGTVTGPIVMSGTTATITGLNSPSANNEAANKGYVDNQTQAIQDIIGTTEDDKTKPTIYGKIAKINADASTLSNTVGELKLYVESDIKDGIDDALSKTNGGTMSAAIAMGGNKITGLATPTEATDAATMGYVDGVKDSITGTSADKANDPTIYGVKAAIKEVSDNLDNLTGELQSLSTVMNFIGSADEDPLTGAGEDGSIKLKDSTVEYKPQNGDVIIYGNYEYVFVDSTKKWEIFGNVTADETRFQKIEGFLGTGFDTYTSTVMADLSDLKARVSTNEGNISDHNTTIGEHDERITAIEDELSGEKLPEGKLGLRDRLAAVEDLAAKAATQLALEAEIKRAQEAEKKISDDLSEFSQNVQNYCDENDALIDSIINPDNEDSLLAWGSF